MSFQTKKQIYHPRFGVTPTRQLPTATFRLNGRNGRSSYENGVNPMTFLGQWFWQRFRTFWENSPRSGGGGILSSSGELTCKGSIQRHPSWRNRQVGSVLQVPRTGRFGWLVARFFWHRKTLLLGCRAMCRPGPGLVSSDPAAARMGWEGAVSKKNTWKFKMGPWGIFLFGNQTFANSGCRLNLPGSHGAVVRHRCSLR